MAFEELSPQQRRFLPQGIRPAFSEPLQNFNPSSVEFAEGLVVSTPLYVLTASGDYHETTLEHEAMRLHGTILSQQGDVQTIATISGGRSTSEMVMGDIRLTVDNEEFEKQIGVIKRKGAGSFVALQATHFPYSKNLKRNNGSPDEPSGTTNRSEYEKDLKNSLELFKIGCRTALPFSVFPHSFVSIDGKRYTIPRYNKLLKSENSNEIPVTYLSGASYAFELIDVQFAIILGIEGAKKGLKPEPSRPLSKMIICDFLWNASSDLNPHIAVARQEILKHLGVNINTQSLQELAQSIKQIETSQIFKVFAIMVKANIDIGLENLQTMREHLFKHGNVHLQNITTGGEIRDNVSVVHLPTIKAHKPSELVRHIYESTDVQRFSEEIGSLLKLLNTLFTQYRQHTQDSDIKISELATIFNTKRNRQNDPETNSLLQYLENKRLKICGGWGNYHISPWG